MPFWGCLVAGGLLALQIFAAPSPLSPDAVVAQTNVYRLKAHVQRLTPNKILTKAAQKKADDMAARGYFGHDTPEGKSPWDSITEAGYSYSAAAENIATNHDSAAAVVKAWMESPGHRRNILDPRFKEIGVGVAKAKAGYIVVELFASPVPANRNAGQE